MRKLFGPAVLVALAFALVGCTGPFPSSGSGSSGNGSDSGSGSGAGGGSGATSAVSCDNGSATYTASSTKNKLLTECDNITIAASNVTVSAQAAKTVSISGSNDTVTATDVGVL